MLEYCLTKLFGEEEVATSAMSIKPNQRKVGVQQGHQNHSTTIQSTVG